MNPVDAVEERLRRSGAYDVRAECVVVWTLAALAALRLVDALGVSVQLRVTLQAVLLVSIFIPLSFVLKTVDNTSEEGHLRAIVAFAVVLASLGAVVSMATSLSFVYAVGLTNVFLWTALKAHINKLLGGVFGQA